MLKENKFIELLEKYFQKLSAGEFLEEDEFFKEFKSEKYKKIVSILSEHNNKMKINKNDITLLLKDSTNICKTMKDGFFEKNRVPEGSYYYQINLLGEDKNNFTKAGIIQVIY